MRCFFLLVLLLGCWGFPAPAQAAAWFNHWHHPISTPSAQAQHDFDQGLLLAYGFSHRAAFRAFERAAQVDPNCAMCYWGMAYVLGPNINTVMSTSSAVSAWDAIQTAISLQDYGTPVEQAYIQALATRYSPNPDADRASLNMAYAGAMRKVAQTYPDDLDAATLFAEALMNTMPWNYWQANGEPTPEGQEIIDTLNSVLHRDRNHVGALHFYIHAVEEKHPERAIAVADRLRDLQIPIGHLVHMPSHIYVSVGRYQDAIQSNQQAIALDQQAIAENDSDRAGYILHNQHFLWYAAMLAGQQQIALSAAKETAELVVPELLRQRDDGALQHYRSLLLYTWIKFGHWDQILAQPAPSADLVYLTGVWHYARGMTWVNQGKLPEAAEELTQLKAIAASPKLDGLTIWDVNSTADLLHIASDVLAGELAVKQGQIGEAIDSFKSAIAKEDHLAYDEPPAWPFPVRPSLGSLLLGQGRVIEAAQVLQDPRIRDVFSNSI